MVSAAVNKTFNWEEYGIRIYVPYNALPGGFSSKITIRVSVSGPFSFPSHKEWKLSSAVYWISCTKSFVHPVQIGLLHTVKGIYNSSMIRFVTSADHDYNGMFIFKELPGGYFDAQDSYGYIYLTHFSAISSSANADTEEAFAARLFYKQETSNSWKCSFVIYKRMAPGIIQNVSS